MTRTHGFYSIYTNRHKVIKSENRPFFLAHHNIIYTDTDSEEIDRQNTQQELDDAHRTAGHRGMHLQLS